MKQELTPENRTALVDYRIERARAAFIESIALLCQQDHIQ